MANAQEVIAGLEILRRHVPDLQVGTRNCALVAYSPDEESISLPTPDQLTSKEREILSNAFWNYYESTEDWTMLF